MAPRQPPPAACYSSALDSPNVSEASLARLRRMATAWGIDGAKVFKAGSATPEGQRRSGNFGRRKEWRKKGYLSSNRIMQKS